MLNIKTKRVELRPKSVTNLPTSWNFDPETGTKFNSKYSQLQ